jgi:hypothetical protein
MESVPDANRLPELDGISCAVPGYCRSRLVDLIKPKNKDKVSSLATRFVLSTGHLYMTNDQGAADAVAAASAAVASEDTSMLGWDPTATPPVDALEADSGDNATIAEDESSGGRKLLVVFLPDDRTRVTPTTSYPA